MKFTTAVRHKMVCLEVAANADSEGRKQLLGVIYDEVARLLNACFIFLTQ